ncbi:hypothetical protein DYB37_013051, partial [Aphanomyces astaci]
MLAPTLPTDPLHPPHATQHSPSVSVAEVRYRNHTKKVAVYEGMSPNECSLLLQAAFFDPTTSGTLPDQGGKVMGFVHLKTKTFLPLSLATAFPQLLQPNHTYELILEKETPAPTIPKHAETPSATSHVHNPTNTTHPHAAPSCPQDQNGEDHWSEAMYNLMVHWDSHPHNDESAARLPLEKLETLLLSQQHPQLHQAFLGYSTPGAATYRNLPALVHQVRRVLAVLQQQTKSSFTRVVNQLVHLKPHDIALIHELFTQ